MQYDQMVIQLVGVAGLIMIGLILFYSFTQCERVDRDRLWVALFLIAIQSVFWALFEQQAASLTLLADQQFNLNFFGINILSSQVGTMNSLFVILLAPIMAWLWVVMAKRRLEPSTPGKFGYALIIIGAGYIVFSWGIGLDDTTTKSFFWLIFIYFMLTLAELFLSPVGLSMVTKLSTSKIMGMMMGTWFLFTALGNNVAGWISSLTGSGVTEGTLDIGSTMNVYTTIGIVSIGVGLFVILMTPLLKKRMHGIH